MLSEVSKYHNSTYMFLSDFNGGAGDDKVLESFIVNIALQETRYLVPAPVCGGQVLGVHLPPGVLEQVI